MNGARTVMLWSTCNLWASILSDGLNSVASGAPRSCMIQEPPLAWNLLSKLRHAP